MAMSEQEHEELKAAVREGIIEALRSEAAQEAVLGAVGAWFDRQSGKAAKKLLIAIALIVVLRFASDWEIFKTWITAMGK